MGCPLRARVLWVLQIWRPMAMRSHPATVQGWRLVLPTVGLLADGGVTTATQDSHAAIEGAWDDVVHGQVVGCTATLTGAVLPQLLRVTPPCTVVAEGLAAGT